MKAGLLQVVGILLFAVAGWRASAQGCLRYPSSLTLQLYPGLTIAGQIGYTNRVEYTTDPSITNSWTLLTNFVLPSTPFFFVDLTSPATNRRFYRAVVVPPPEPVPVTNMVWIERGSFTMGSPTNEADRFSDEGPETQVTLTRGFWLGRYEVTRREFATIMGYVPGSGLFLDLPANDISWSEAVEYCAKLTQLESSSGHISAQFYSYRLPTEAEWEYAARAGTSTRFFYGDDPGYTSLSNYAWFGDGAWIPVTLHFGGEKLPSPWGLYDIYGNVLEYCSDWYDRYPGGSVVNWAGPPFGDFHVARGGTSGLDGRLCRSAARRLGNDRLSPYGFRIVLSCQ